MTTAVEATLDWVTDVNDAPFDSRPARNPFRTRAWAAAWQRQATERILAHRHATVTDHSTGVRETIDFLLVHGNGSPYWTSQETDAGVDPVWPGPVLWAGSPHAEYGGAGTATTAMTKTLLDAGHELARELGACALALPGLDPAQAERVAAVRGPVLDLATDVAFTRQLGEDHDMWWAGMPASHRREARRQWRRGTEAGLVLQVHHGPTSRPMLDAFHLLAERTAGRHGSPLYGADMLHQLADVPGTVLLAACNEVDLVGGVYGWLHDGCLYLWASGIDYNHRLAPRTYTWLMGEAALWAIDHGATSIDAGRWNCQAKIRLGYQPTILRTAVRLTSPDPGTAQRLQSLSDRLGMRALPFTGAHNRW
ncbi:GNAT family N-acetyltransferase [Streptomyces sp. NPDC014735]|uniref:GNAT family N-acetyltransferase n=1 Tax=Streptomyces sp. NPDC014735 TaxID=3364887 RepID=UPI0036FF5892